MTKKTFNPENLGRGLGLHRLRQNGDNKLIEFTAEDQHSLEVVQSHLQIMGADGRGGNYLSAADFASCGVNRSCLEDDPAILIDVFVNETPDEDRDRFLKHLNNCYACSRLFASTLQNYHRGYNDYYET